jgi:D-alanyl-D-alanine endopeptidase (penicillin-binding protein 7)
MIKFILGILISTLAYAQPSVWLYDETRGEAVIVRNANEQRPIASITKLMTAIVTLRYDQDLDRRISVPRGSHLSKGYHSRKEVLTAMLVKSDNQAAVALAEDYPGGVDNFVRKMNQTAAEMKLYQTQFVDPNGLGRNNMSTAAEVAEMVRVSSLIGPIRDISTIKVMTLERQVKVKKKPKTKLVQLPNTNTMLLNEFKETVVSKTGFTNPAGFCVAMAIEKDHHKLSVVVLGAKDKRVRFALAKQAVSDYLRDLEVKNVRYRLHRV